jgi:hypothetical protein
MNNVTNYASFAEWHNLHHGSAYRTPSFDAVMVDMKGLGRQFDVEKGTFYFFMGTFAPVPGLRMELTWKEVAMRYDSMYSDFARYGTN